MFHMPHIRKNAALPPFKTIDRSKLTPNGGLVFLEALCRRLNLWDQVNQEEFPRVPHQTLGIRQNEAVIAQILFSIARGGSTLAEAAMLQHDPLLLRMVGLKQAADERTLNEWLMTQTESSVKALRRLNAKQVAVMIQDSQVVGTGNNHRPQTNGELDVAVREKRWAISEVSSSARDRLNSNQLCWRTLSVGPFLCDGLWSVEPNVGTKCAQTKEFLESHRGIWSDRKPYFSCGEIPNGLPWQDLANVSGFGLWTAEVDEYTVRDNCNFDMHAKTNKWVLAKSRDSLFEKFCTAFPKASSVEKVPGVALIARRGLNAHGIAEDRFLLAPSGTRLSPESLFARHFGIKAVVHQVVEDLNLYWPLSLAGTAREAYYAIASLAFNLLTALKLLLAGRDWTVREVISGIIATPARLSSSHNRDTAIYFGTTPDWPADWGELIKPHIS